MFSVFLYYFKEISMGDLKFDLNKIYEIEKDFFILIICRKSYLKSYIEMTVLLENAMNEDEQERFLSLLQEVCTVKNI